MGTRYVLYQNGTMSVITPLSKLKPNVLLPLRQTSSAPLIVVEIRLPKKEIDAERVLLLDERGQGIPLERQTTSQQDGFLRVRFHLRKEAQTSLAHALVFYLDLNPQIEWSATYSARFANMTRPNQAEISSFICSVRVKNQGETKVGPGDFNIMVQQIEMGQPIRGAKQKMRRLPRASEGALPAMAMRTMSSAPVIEEIEERKLSASTGSAVAEGFIVHLPGVITFDTMDTSQQTIFKEENIPVKKVHWVTLEGPLEGYARVKYICRLPTKNQKQLLLPGGTLNLFSDTLDILAPPQLLNNMLAGSEITLLESQDQRVHVQGNVTSEEYQIDVDGNKVTAHSGGLAVKHYYDETLKLIVYVPVQKVKNELKHSSGVKEWIYEPQRSRVKLFLEVPPQDKQRVEFLIYSSDPIQVKERPSVNVNVSKKQLLRELLE